MAIDDFEQYVTSASPPPASSGESRTDRHRNPIAVAVGSGGKNQFTQALDDVGIPWEHGDAFPPNEGGSSMRTIRINGDPYEASRAILTRTNAIQGWYAGKTGKVVLTKYNVRTNHDFAKLPTQSQDEIISGIYQAEGGKGKLKPAPDDDFDKYVSGSVAQPANSQPVSSDDDFDKFVKAPVLHVATKVDPDFGKGSSTVSAPPGTPRTITIGPSDAKWHFGMDLDITKLPPKAQQVLADAVAEDQRKKEKYGGVEQPNAQYQAQMRRRAGLGPVAAKPAVQPETNLSIGELRQQDEPAVASSAFVRARDAKQAGAQALRTNPNSAQARLYDPQENVAATAEAEQAKASQEAEWRRVNQPAIDAKVATIRKAIRRQGGFDKWLAEFGEKAVSGLIEPAGAVSNAARVQSEAMMRAAEEEGVDRNVVSKFIQNTAAGLVGSAPEMAAMALGAPAIPTFALGGGVRAAAKGQDIPQGVIHGGLSGAAFELPIPGATRMVERPIAQAVARGVTTGVGSTAVELGAGRSLKEAAATGATMGLMSGGGQYLHGGGAKAPEVEGTPPVSAQAPAEPIHHSQFQERDAGQFAGPVDKQALEKAKSASQGIATDRLTISPEPEANQPAYLDRWSLKDKSGNEVGVFTVKTGANGQRSVNTEYLGDEYRGQGYGREATKALADHYGEIYSDPVESSDSAVKAWKAVGAEELPDDRASDGKPRFVLRSSVPESPVEVPTRQSDEPGTERRQGDPRKADSDITGARVSAERYGGTVTKTPDGWQTSWPDGTKGASLSDADFIAQVREQVDSRIKLPEVNKPGEPNAEEEAGLTRDVVNAAKGPNVLRNKPVEAQSSESVPGEGQQKPAESSVAPSQESDIGTIEKRLQEGPLHVDVVAKELGWDRDRVKSALIGLELRDRALAKPHDMWEAKATVSPPALNVENAPVVEPRSASEYLPPAVDEPPAVQAARKAAEERASEAQSSAATVPTGPRKSELAATAAPEQTADSAPKSKLSRAQKKLLAQAQTEEGAAVKNRRRSNGRAALDTTTQSLSQAVRADGGMRYDRALRGGNRGELGRLSPRESKTTGLVNDNSPHDVEDMALRMAQEGYRGDWVTVETTPDGPSFQVDGNKFLEAVENDHRGIKTYAGDHEVDYEATFRDAHPDEMASADALVSFLENEERGKLFDDVSEGLANETDIQTFTALAKTFGVSGADIESIVSKGRALAAKTAGIQDTSSVPARPAQQLGFSDEGLTLQDSTPQTGTDQRGKLRADEEDRQARSVSNNNGTDTVEALQRLRESSDSSIRAKSQALWEIARWRKVDADQVKALETLDRLRRTGQTVDDYANQDVLFGERPTDREISALRNLASDPSLVARARSRLAQGATDKQAGIKLFGSGGPDTQPLIDHMLVHGWDAYQSGKKTFNEWSAEMKRRFHEDIEPHLRSVWAQLTGQHEDPDVADRSSEIVRHIEDRNLRGLAESTAEFSPENRTRVQGLVAQIAQEKASGTTETVDRPATETGDQAASEVPGPDQTTQDGSASAATVPGEPSPVIAADGGADTTGIKHAVVEAERELAGLPQFAKARRSHGESFDQGVEAVRNGSIDPGALAAQVAEEPRPLSTKESMALLYDRMRISVAKESAAKALETANESGDAEQINEALDRVRQLETASGTNDKAVYLAGGEQGRGLAIRRELINRDYSRAVVTAKYVARNRGKALDTDVQELVDSFTDELERAHKRIADLEAGQESRESAIDADKFVREQKLEVRRRGRQRKQDEILTERADLKQQLAQVWRKTHGDLVQPVGIQAGDIEMARLLGKLARNFIESGVLKAGDLVDAVHEHVKDVTDLTKRQVSDLISGYGKVKTSTSDVVEKKLNEIKSILAATSGKADILEKNIRAAKRGQQRDKPTEDERRATRELQEAMREFGSKLADKPYDPKTQQATPLDKAKTTARNRGEQLRSWIESGKKEVNGREQLIPDAELKQLKAENAALEKVVALLDDPAADQKMIDRRVTELEKAISRARADINNPQGPTVKEGARQPWSPEISTLENERLILKKIANDVQAEAERKAREAPQPNAGFYGATGSWADYEAEAQQTLNAQRSQAKQAQKKVEQLQATLDAMRATGERPAKTAKVPTPETDELKVARRNAQVLQTSIDQLGEVIDWRNKNVAQKGLAYTAAGVRAGVLTGTRTIGKIGSAIAQSTAQQYLGEPAGEVARQLLPRTAALAPRHGRRLNAASEAAFVGGMGRGVKEIPRALRTGETAMTLEHGESHPAIPTRLGNWLAAPGRVHMAEKNVLGSGEYARAKELYLQRAERITPGARDSADVQQSAGESAYKHAKEIMMLGDNPFSRAVQAVRRTLGKPGGDGQVISRIVVPIERVPSNYVFSHLIGEFGLGLPRGIVRGVRSELQLRDALRKAVADTSENYMNGTIDATVAELERRNPGLMEHLSPEESDKTIRMIKRGSVGLIYMTLGGVLGAGSGAIALGGFSGGAGDKKEVKPGDLKIGSVTIPHFLLHSAPNDLANFVSTVKREIQSQVATDKGDTTLQRAQTGVGQGVKGVAKQVPFLNEYVDVVNSMRDRDAASTQAGRWLATRVEPQIMQELARATDREETEDRKRKPKGFVQALEVGIPGLRETIPFNDRALEQRTRRDAGRSIVQKERAGESPSDEILKAKQEGILNDADIKRLVKSGKISAFQGRMENILKSDRLDGLLDYYDQMSPSMTPDQLNDLRAVLRRAKLTHNQFPLSWRGTTAEKDVRRARLDKALGVTSASAVPTGP